MEAVSCLKQKGIGPSEWKVRAFLLPKQNVRDDRSCMAGAIGVVRANGVWEPKKECWGKGMRFMVAA